MSIKKRKKSHVEITLDEDVANKRVSTGFDDVDFIHCALPEIDFHRISTGVKFFKKELSAPLIMDSMTGGYGGATAINKALAAAAEKAGIAFALGSQRAMTEDPALKSTYYVRDVAPSIPIIGNIGAVNLKEKGMIQKVEAALKEVDADALAIHLNPLQEAIQPEGDKDFGGCLAAIAETCKSVDVPVIVKEVGCGISGDVASKLERAGVSMINVAGAGGTSWGRIELLRSEGRLESFGDSGIPTVVSLLDTLRFTSKPVIVSGGVRNGLDVAKGIALGASYAAAARPLLLAWKSKQLDETLSLWKDELRIAMFMAGASDLKQLKATKPLIAGRTAELLRGLTERGKWMV